MTATDTQTSKQYLGDCEPLLALANPELYRRNLFRVLGVRVDASLREVSRQQQRRRMQEKLGIIDSPEETTGLWGPLASDADRKQAQEVMGRPVERAIHELFWFWPETVEAAALKALDLGQIEECVQIWETQPDARTRGIGKHNLAVLYHAQVLESERTASAGMPQDQRDAWRRALAAWKEVCDAEDFWDLYRARLREMDDAQLTTGLLRRVRGTLPQGLMVVSATLAYEAASKGDAKRASALLEVPREAGFRDAEVREALRVVLAPLRERIKDAVERTRRDCLAEPRWGDQRVRRLHEQTADLLATVDCLLPEADASRAGLHDAVAEGMLHGLVAFGERTQKWADSAELHKVALSLAGGAAVRGKLADNLATVKGLEREGLFWCAPGYWNLPDDQIAALEAARAKVEANDFDEGLANLLELDPQLGLPLRRALAYTLNLRSVKRINTAQEQLSGSALGHVVTEVVQGVILADELQPGFQTLIDNRKGIEELARRLGVAIPTSAALRKSLVAEMALGTEIDLAPDGGPTTCHFCGENDGAADAALAVPMCGSVRAVELMLGDGQAFEFGMASVPRCLRCRDAHETYPDRLEAWHHVRITASSPEHFPALVAEVETKRKIARDAHVAVESARREAREARALVAKSAETGTRCERCGKALDGALCPECDLNIFSVGDDWKWVAGVAALAGAMAVLFGWEVGLVKAALLGGLVSFGELVFGNFRKLQTLAATRTPLLVRNRLIAVEGARAKASAAEKRYAERLDEHDNGAAAMAAEAAAGLVYARERALQTFESAQPRPELDPGIKPEGGLVEFPLIVQRRAAGWGFGSRPLSDATVSPQPVDVTGLVSRHVAHAGRPGWALCPTCSRAFELEDDTAAYRFDCDCGSTFDYGQGETELVLSAKDSETASGAAVRRADVVLAVDAAGANDFLVCPVCSAQTKAKNLLRHFDRLHAGEITVPVGDHVFNSNDICSDCGCSRGAIEKFGYECKKG